MSHSYKHLDEKDLLVALSNSDKLAFSEIYERYWDQLYNSVYKRAADHDVTFDIIQDVFCSLWARREVLEIENLAGYLFQSTKFQTFKFLRRSQLEVTLKQNMDVDAFSPPSDIGILEKEAIHKVGALILKFTPKQRELFKLRYEEHKTTLQIAEMQNLSRKTIQNQLSFITLEIKKRLYHKS